MQTSPLRLERSGDAHRELLEAQAELQTSQEGAAAATQEKEAARKACAELEQELSAMKVRVESRHSDRAAYPMLLALPLFCRSLHAPAPGHERPRRLKTCPALLYHAHADLQRS